MWELDRHPMLASTMGSIMVLAGTPSPLRFTSTVANAVAAIPALHHRVSAPALPLADLEWEPDPDFDLDHHVRLLRLPPRAGIDTMLDAATRIINDPFDRSRPPWSMTLLTGLPKGRSALVVKAHHSIADGQGLVSLGMHLFDLAAEAPEKPAIDLAAVLAEQATASGPTKESMTEAIRGKVERILGLAVDTVGTLGSPNRTAGLIDDIAATTNLLGGGVVDRPSASALWQRRSRNRRSFHLGTSLADLRRQADERGCSINDLFVTASAEAAIGYHLAKGESLEHVSTSVVVSTRTVDHDDAHNAVIPFGIVVPGVGASTGDRLQAVKEQVAARRAAVGAHQRGIDAAQQMAGFLPTSIAAAAALDQSRKLDIATSNLPGPPLAMWLAGEGIEWISPLGPVAGTACNITMLTFCDDAALGVHYDPSAVADAPLLASELRSSLARLHIDSRNRAIRTR